MDEPKQATPDADMGTATNPDNRGSANKKNIRQELGEWLKLSHKFLFIILILVGIGMAVGLFPLNIPAIIALADVILLHYVVETLLEKFLSLRPGVVELLSHLGDLLRLL